MVVLICREKVQKNKTISDFLELCTENFLPACRCLHFISAGKPVGRAHASVVVHIKMTELDLFLRCGVLQFCKKFLWRHDETPPGYAFQVRPPHKANTSRSLSRLQAGGFPLLSLAEEHPRTQPKGAIQIDAVKIFRPLRAMSLKSRAKAHCAIIFITPALMPGL